MPEPTEAPIRPVRIGDRAPNFRARTTLGDCALSDYRGRWLLFFSHPADFTPVCTTEFLALSRAAGRFAALNCALLGLSVDSLYAHLAWVRAIRQAFDTEIAFPIVEDPSMAIGRAFGMIDDRSADSMAMRSTFFIDPSGIVRAITCYPHNVGRSVDEMIRLLQALQHVSASDRLAPEGWQPGDPTLAPPPATAGGADDEPDWFCRYRSDR